MSSILLSRMIARWLACCRASRQCQNLKPYLSTSVAFRSWTEKLMDRYCLPRMPLCRCIAMDISRELQGAKKYDMNLCFVVHFREPSRLPLVVLNFRLHPENIPKGIMRCIRRYNNKGVMLSAPLPRARDGCRSRQFLFGDRKKNALTVRTLCGVAHIMFPTRPRSWPQRRPELLLPYGAAYRIGD